MSRIPVPTSGSSADRSGPSPTMSRSRFGSFRRAIAAASSASSGCFWKIRLPMKRTTAAAVRLRAGVELRLVRARQVEAPAERHSARHRFVPSVPSDVVASSSLTQMMRFARRRIARAVASTRGRLAPCGARSECSPFGVKRIRFDGLSGASRLRKPGQVTHVGVSIGLPQLSSPKRHLGKRAGAGSPSGDEHIVAAVGGRPRESECVLPAAHHAAPSERAEL